ncbi:MAG: DUF309 domain-containing protein [Timaviella obliquedivisa GSE-PSE-MK23-08B]|jgi:hypothetical protein|nr:DUF309 domain-containing protein [Timaviella obliquedivisa GSE-PSE-MK23-08B]
MTEEVEPTFWDGVEQFNQQEFYACHDTLEAIWMEAMEPHRTFYQSILQIAVALYHLSNGNLRGATILLGEGLNRLRRYQPVYAEVDVTALIAQSTELLIRLQQAQLVEGAIAPSFPMTEFPTITLAIAPKS